MPNANQANLDGDDKGDACDSDVDGDGAHSGDDAFPRDPKEQRDTDKDGVGDNGDAFPNDPAESKDGDLDRVELVAEPDGAFQRALVAPALVERQLGGRPDHGGAAAQVPVDLGQGGRDGEGAVALGQEPELDLEPGGPVVALPDLVGALADLLERDRGLVCQCPCPRGMGPGGGTRKFGLPEAHTDYIFSVIGEEFGLVACAGIAILFLALVVRVFVKLLDEQDEFRLLASAGLATQFGAQALISMAVNTGLAPSKGMTLPFISYGGSSMIALSIGMGLLLAFTRRNPFLTRSPYVVRWSGA